MGFKQDEVYKLTIDLGRNRQKIFKGKLIEETSKFITLKSKNYAESFLKEDIGKHVKLL